MNYTTVTDNILAKDDNTSETSEAGDEEYENLNNLENANIKDDTSGTMSGELGASPEPTNDDFLPPPTSNPNPTPNLGGKTRKKKRETSKKKKRKGKINTIKKKKRKGKTRKNKKKQSGGLNRIGTGIGSNCYDPNYSIYNTNLTNLFPYKP